MRRPFFILAVFIAVFIWAANFFMKGDYYRPEHISHFVSQKPRHLAVNAVIISSPTVKCSADAAENSFLAAPRLVRISDKWFPACGIMSAVSLKGQAVEYGDEILFEAAVRAPSEGKGSGGYSDYLRKKGIFALAVIREKDALIPIGWEGSRFLRFAYRMRKMLGEKINKIFSVPARHFISALVLGERQNISRKWEDIFVNTQTIHLLAISGLHIVILSFIILFVVELFGMPRGLKYAAVSLLILFYSVMVGWMPSVARSAIMAVVIMGSFALSQDADIYNSLGLAASLILIFQPNQLFDMGFILSFGSVWSLAYIYPKISRGFGFDRIPRNGMAAQALYYTAGLFSASLAVWLGIFPIILYVFNVISVTSIIVNILAIPCMFIVMALTASTIIFQVICAFLGTAFKEATEFFLALFLLLVDMCAQMPFAYFKTAPVNVVVIPLYYFILFAVLERKTLEQNITGRQ